MSLLKKVQDGVKGTFDNIKLIFDTVRGKDPLVPWEHKPSDPLKWLEPTKPHWPSGLPLNEQPTTQETQPLSEQEKAESVFFALGKDDKQKTWAIGDGEGILTRITQGLAQGELLSGGHRDASPKFIEPIDTKNLDL